MELLRVYELGVKPLGHFSLSLTGPQRICFKFVKGSKGPT